MSTVEITKRMAATSAGFRGKLVVAYYVLTIVTGVFVLFFRGRLAFAADVAVAILYLAVTVLFWASTHN